MGFTPQQISQAYGFDKVTLPGVPADGTGQTIAIVDAFDNPAFVDSTDANFANSDLAQFDAQFKIQDPPSFMKMDQTGGTNLPAPGNTIWKTEIALDVEWLHALVPNASIILVEADSASNADLFTAVQTAANLPNVSVVSMSFGGAETLDEINTDSIFTSPFGRGITFVAATGDSGSPGQYPAYSPNVLAVGGTTLKLDNSGNYSSETGWSGSGGGLSTIESTPPYQSVLPAPPLNRGIPDVAFDGDTKTGVAVYDSADNGSATPWEAVGGTSLGAPAWSAIVALADEGLSSLGLSTLDGFNSTLPALYNAPANIFHDITSGSNGQFTAGPGYDNVTGLGTPFVNFVVPALAGTPLNSISGTVFNDLNGDGIQEDGEIGLAGWQLYLDVNGTGVFAPNDPSVFTDANGNYTFGDLPDGDYSLREVVQSGFSQTTPNASLNLTLAGANTTFVSIGDFKQTTVSGEVFFDANGTHDPIGQASLAGWTVQLVDTSGQNPTMTTTSAADGTYSFKGVGPGTFTVQEVVQQNWNQSSPVPVPPGTFTFQNMSGIDTPPLSFGNTTDAISGTVFEDVNGDKLPEAGENGLKGWTVFLDANNNGMLDSGEQMTTTDANGNFNFQPLADGSYTVREVVQAGWVQTTPPVPIVTVAGGQLQSGLLIGNFKETTITGTVFDDLNSSGLSAGQPGLSAWTIELLDSTGAMVTSTMTGDNGGYSIAGVGPGTFTLQEMLQTGWTQTAPQPVPPGTYTISNTSGLDVPMQDFGNTTNTIAGTVFNDINGNTQQDPGEGTLSGWTVELLDVNNNNAVVKTTVSDSNGNFVLAQFPDGVYQVDEVVMPGWVETTTPQPFAISGGTSLSGVLVGNFQTTTVSGKVFADQSQSHDPTQPGLAGWAITLVDQFGSPLNFALSDLSGNYTMSNVGPGTFTVLETLQAGGWQQDFPTTGTYTFTNRSGVAVTNQDFGNFLPNPNSITALVYNDVNGNGTQDPGEPGLSGFMVNLMDSSGHTIQSVTSDSNGNATFSILPDGTYTVAEVVQTGFVQTEPAQNMIQTVQVAGGQDATGVPFGNFQTTTISGTVFNDLNGDGTFEPGQNEVGIANVNLILTDQNGAQVGGAISGADGSYSFFNIGPGSFTVEETVPPGEKPTSPTAVQIAPNLSGTNVTGLDFGNFILVKISGEVFEDLNGDGVLDNDSHGNPEPGLAGFTVTLENQNGDMLQTTTSDQDGKYMFTGVGFDSVNNRFSNSFSVVLTPQAPFILTGNNGTITETISSGQDLTDQNFGNFKPVTISGEVFNDLNGDGTRGPNDPGLDGWMINLRDNSGVIVTSTTTVNGQYSFTNQGPGSFTIEEIPLTLSWIQTTPATIRVTTTSSTDLTNEDFGNFFPITISGTVVTDITGSGTRSADDTPLQNWEIDLVDASNNVTRKFTGADGTYSFANLGPGTYTIKEILQDGFIQTFPASPGTYTVPAKSQTDSSGNDFGIFQLGTVTGTTFGDTNANGVLDSDETGIPGVTVQLLDGNNVVQTVTSDDNGNYAFTNVGAGTFHVTEVVMPGFIQTTLPVPVTITSGGSVTANLGNFEAASISGEVFQDFNANGSVDSGDNGLAGWTVQALNDSGIVVGSAVTDDNGNYTIIIGQPGTYHLQEIVMPGWQPTSTSPSGIVINTGGQMVTDQNFGNFQQVSITGQVFVDIGGDGNQDTGDPALAGVTIQLISASGADAGTIVQTTATDSTGTYTFTGVGLGVFHVREVVPAGFVQTTADPDDFAGTSGGVVSGGNFGVFQLGSVSGRVFEDFNGNGQLDGSENGLSGWTVQVIDSLGNVAQTQTDSAGNFVVTGVGPGALTITEVVQPGWLQTSPQLTGLSITSGGNLTGQNIGNFQLVSINGRVFVDLGGSGAESAADPGFDGITLQLYRDEAGTGVFDPSVDTLITSTVSGFLNGRDGAYLLTGAGPGTYFVVEARSPGNRATFPTPPVYTITVSQSGDNIGGLDFGNLATAGQSFVFQLYLDMLSRRPDPSGFQFFTGALAAGASRAQVVSAIEGSLEYRTDRIEALYHKYLGRDGDAGGIQFSLSLLSNLPVILGGGDAYLQLQSMFLASPEYYARNGGTTEGFLAGIYRDVLGRDIDPTGAAGFGAAMAGGTSRTLVAKAILSSLEGEQDQIQSDYIALLHRTADPTGMQAFFAFRQHGGRDDDVIAAILGSEEYFSIL